MEVVPISDAISSVAYSTQSFGLSNFLTRPHDLLSLPDTNQPPRSPPPFRIFAASQPPTRTLTKRRLRRIRRARRRISIDYDGGENGMFVPSDGGGFSCGDGYFGGGGGGGGKGWNWEGFSDNCVPDPAFDFVYGVLCWIALSNCLHFAFKKVVRLVEDGVVDQGKVPMQLAPAVC
ncbi:glycine-rich protein [Striga hermonthica]|uniref:Glycine-rich protein n=1 Tax=Striga hermonthica TaxID=68872 RepID=A0A9N7NNZ9_STRHE|nr:glycine-rich protein [Striga hermonthica]